MWKWLLVCFLMATPVLAAEPGFKEIYGGIFTGCTVASDLDEGGGGDVNRIGPLVKDKLYSVFCYDSATFLGVACKVKQGGSTVDASAGEGSTGEAELVFAGTKTGVFITSDMNYISFEPLADGTTQIGVACPRN
jgi:hypothetical protein